MWHRLRDDALHDLPTRSNGQGGLDRRRDGEGLHGRDVTRPDSVAGVLIAYQITAHARRRAGESGWRRGSRFGGRDSPSGTWIVAAMWSGAPSARGGNVDFAPVPALAKIVLLVVGAVVAAVALRGTPARDRHDLWLLVIAGAVVLPL